jgi:hypothetical protein
MSKIMNAIEMGFVRIAEAYPDEFILVRIVEIDHEKGKETGIAIYTAASRQELIAYAKKEGILESTIIIQGENLIPLIGGLL